MVGRVWKGGKGTTRGRDHGRVREGGCEGGIHAVNEFLTNISHNKVVLVKVIEQEIIHDRQQRASLQVRLVSAGL